VAQLLLAADAFHDKSKAPFYIAAGVLVAWALLVSAIGIRSGSFPTSKILGRAAILITVVIVAVTAAMAVVTAKTPPPAHRFDTGVTTNGVGPAFTPVSASAKPTSGPIALAANPGGELAFTTTALTATSSHVTIDFTNRSPLPHNVTIANAAGHVFGNTPTFAGGTKTLTLDLPPGTYTFYCSVPGHEQAGMKGTLTVK
jgi:plastocyanin